MCAASSTLSPHPQNPVKYSFQGILSPLCCKESDSLAALVFCEPLPSPLRPVRKGDLPFGFIFSSTSAMLSLSVHMSKALTTLLINTHHILFYKLSMISHCSRKLKSLTRVRIAFGALRFLCFSLETRFERQCTYLLKLEIHHL